MLRIFLIAIATFSALLMTSCNKPGDEILIGEVGSLTGNEATFGTSTRDGIELAVRQANASGGVKGKKLRVVVLDDQGKSEEAATAVTRLVTQDKVVAVLGEAASSKSLAMAPIAQSFKVPMITPSSTNPGITKAGEFVFRTCFTDPFQAWVMAQFAAKSLKVKKAAVLRDMKNDYSVSLSNIFIEDFKKMGGEIVAEQSYSSGDVDFKSQLTSIKSKNPDVVYLPGYYTEVGLIGRQAKELGFTAPFLGGDAWDSAKLTEIAAGALDGSYFSNFYSPEDKAPETQKFIADYKSAFGAQPDSIAAMGYDAARVLIEALRRAASDSSDDLRKAILETKDFRGATGRITFVTTRDAQKSAVVIQIKNNKFVYKETINPN